MKIAVLSDSHDNIWKLAQAMPHLASADAIIHCGDLCSPFMIARRLGEGAGHKPLHVVWGNNDGDRLLIARNARPFPEITLHGEIRPVRIGRAARRREPLSGRGPRVRPPLPSMIWCAMGMITPCTRSGSESACCSTPEN